jgi:hypothetical protein
MSFMKQSIPFIRSFFFVYPIIAMCSRLPGALQPVRANGFSFEALLLSTTIAGIFDELNPVVYRKFHKVCLIYL